MTYNKTILDDTDLQLVTGGLGWGQTAYINGQRGQVIAPLPGKSGSTVVETRDFSGRSTGTTTLTPYDLNFRSQLHSVTPSFRVGPRNMHELNSLRSRGF
jgi:hypothetical protein